MELMAGWDRVILVDCIQFDNLEAGTVLPIAPDDLRTSLKLRSVHEIDLPTALKLGDRLGLAMPQEVRIFGIRAQDAWTFGESLSPAAARGMQRAADLILQQLGDRNPPARAPSQSLDWLLNPTQTRMGWIFQNSH